MDKNPRLTANTLIPPSSKPPSLHRSHSTSPSHFRSKNHFSSYGSSDIKDFLIIGITCINCQAIVPEPDIEEHSLRCTTLSSSLVLAEQSPVKELHFKLQKLYSFFVMLLSCKMKDHERDTLDMLKRTVTMLLHMREEAHIKYIQEIEQSVTLFTHDLEESLGFQIYTHRVISLAQELITSIKLETKKKQVDSLKRQIEKYRKKASTLQQVLSKGTRSQPQPVGLSPRYLTDCGNLINKDMNDLSWNDKGMIEIQSSNEDMKRYFFSVALAYKLNFNPNHPVQKVDLHKAYERILSLNDSIENWPKLIEKDLNRAANLIPTKRKSRGSQPRSGRFYAIDTIIEEEEPSSAFSKDSSPLIRECK